MKRLLGWIVLVDMLLFAASYADSAHPTRRTFVGGAR